MGRRLPPLRAPGTDRAPGSPGGARDERTLDRAPERAPRPPARGPGGSRVIREIGARVRAKRSERASDARGAELLGCPRSNQVDVPCRSRHAVRAGHASARALWLTD